MRIQRLRGPVQCSPAARAARFRCPRTPSASATALAVGLRLLLLVLQPVAAHAAWVVDERGDCVRAWTPTSLARGPAAIANAPLLPFRSAVGGAQVAGEDRSPGLRRKIMLTPLLTVGGAVMGVLESAIWLTTGLADTLTGGYFEVSPDEATTLSLAPQRPPFITEPVRESRSSSDRCGRSTR